MKLKYSNYCIRRDLFASTQKDLEILVRKQMLKKINQHLSYMTSILAAEELVDRRAGEVVGAFEANPKYFVSCWTATVRAVKACLQPFYQLMSL